MVKEGSLGRPVSKGADARYTRLPSSGQSRKASQALQNCLLDKVGVRAWWERAEGALLRSGARESLPEDTMLPLSLVILYKGASPAVRALTGDKERYGLSLYCIIWERKAFGRMESRLRQDGER